MMLGTSLQQHEYHFLRVAKACRCLQGALEYHLLCVAYAVVVSTRGTL